jgi:hypothetical protein
MLNKLTTECDQIQTTSVMNLIKLTRAANFEHFFNKQASEADGLQKVSTWLQIYM